MAVIVVMIANRISKELETMSAGEWRQPAGLLFLVGVLLMAVVHAADSQNAKLKDAQARDDSYALVVGISDYRNRTTREWLDLHGAEDAETMRQALHARGIPEDHICVLKNEQATRIGIERAFRDCLIKPVRKGATLVFYFSGHGGRVLDDNGDEADGLDEALIPYDWDAAPDRRNYLRDDRLAELLDAARQAMQDPGGALQGNLVVFLDSCFSGTATRGDDSAAIYRGQAKLPTGRPSSLAPHALAKGPSGFLSIERGSAQIVVMSATQADESAVELPLSEGAPPQGVFTYALTEALKARQGPRTYRALFEAVRYFVTERAPNQHPQLEGSPEATNRALFTHQSLYEGNYIPIEKVDPVQGLVTLPVGLLHGATPGSRYALFPAGKELGLIRGCRPDQGCLATVTLGQVGAARSTAPIPAGVAAARLAAGRAVEIAHNHPETPPVRVYVAPDTPVPAGLFSSRADSVVVLGSEAEHDVRIEQKGRVLWALHARAPSGAVLFRRELGSLATQLAPSAISGVLGDLAQALRAHWTYRHLVNLRGTNSALAVGLRVARVTKPEAPKVAPDGVEFDLNEEVELELQNEGPRGVYVALLELTPRGDINVLYPNARRQRGITSNFVPATNDWKRLDVRVRLNPVGRSLWKLLITEQPADFAGIAHQTVLKGQSAAPTVATLPAQVQPLGRLLQSAALHLRSQSIQMAPDGWMTRDYFVSIRGPGSSSRQAAP